MRLTRGAQCYCPYCYEDVSRRPAWFRCSGRLSPGGQRCAPEADPVLRERTGFGGALPPAFTATARQGTAVCPACRAETTTRICPVCHSRLPVHFGRVGSRMIVPVGAKEAGKTVFMTVLVHELMHQTGQRLDAAVTGADDHTRHRYVSEYERPLYRDSTLLPPTTGAGAPLVFRFTTADNQTLLSFFDTAGENLRSAQAIEQNARYLGAADGILLLLDPLQMRGARDLAAPGTRLPTPGGPDDDPATVLENVTDLLMTGAGKPGRQITKPLAIVFTKMDALLGDLRPTSPLLRPPPDVPYFHERDSLDVHTEIQRLLARWEGTRIDQIAQLNYRNYRYFGVSALGETPTGDNHVAARGIRPYRVASPVLWILAQFGIVGVR